MGRRLAEGRRWRVSILLLLLATAAAGPLLFSAGFLNTRGGGDSPFLLFRLHQMTAALADGHFPVRWMPDAAYGLGYPFFSFYAGLPFYVGALFYFWGFGLVAAVKLTQWLGFLLAAGAMWGLVRELERASKVRWGNWGAWLAAAAYTFAPYHLVNVYVRGDSLTEFWAMGLYPLVLWLALRLWRQPGRGRLLLFALGYAALILTHNISALIFSPFLFLFLMVLAPRGKKLVWLAAALLLALALSAFYWLPALGEQGTVQLGEQTSGYFHYSNHFRDLGVGSSSQALVQSSWLFDYQIEGQTPFSMGLLQCILALAGIILFLVNLFRPSERRFPISIPLFALFTLGVSTWMMTPSSGFLWEYLPLLPMIQFPWRLLSVQAFAVALLAAPLADVAVFKRPRFFLPALLILLVAWTALGALEPDRVALNSADVNPERLQLYEWFSTNVGTTIRYEYLPQAVLPRPYTSEALVTHQAPQARVISGEAVARQKERRTGREIWQVEVRSETAALSFPTLYWPGWQARVDGQKVALQPAESVGLLTLHLPAGQHTVYLTLGRTPLRLGAELLSGLSLLAGLVWLGWNSDSLVRLRRLLPAALWFAAGVVVVGLVLHLLPVPSLTSDDLTWDFDQQAFLHHNPQGVPFGDAALMESYRYQEQEAGWSVWVQWTQVSRPGLEVELSLVHPAQVTQGVPYTLALARQTLPAGGGELIFFLPRPETAPLGPLLPRLRLLDREGDLIPALTSAGRSRGDLYLRPVWIEEASPVSVPGTGLRLADCQVNRLGSEMLEAALQWEVGEPVSANYKLALRLRDLEGGEWSALDTQPGYGYFPTFVWQAGTAFKDRLLLKVPYGLPPGDYVLSVSLYDAATLAPFWGPQDCGVSLATAAPYDGRALLHQFTPGLAIVGLQFPDQVLQGEHLSFSVSWLALDDSEGQPTIGWELRGEAGDLVASGTEAPPLASGSVILNRQEVAIDPGAAPGEYALWLTVPGGSPWRAATVSVRPQARLFELPELEFPLGQEFGNLIRLEGANWAQDSTVLSLTLYWRALDRIPADYTVFVHLYDPLTESIVAQSDTMPRDNSYPSSRWVADEVVEDPRLLSLLGVPPGRYRLGVGLYRIENGQFLRLPAVDSNGEPVPADRVVLPFEITIP